MALQSWQTMSIGDYGGQSWEDAAQAVFLSGRYSQFLAFVQKRPVETVPAEIRFFAAKALARLGRPHEALAQLRSVAAAPGCTPDVALQALLQQSVVEIVLGNEDRALECIETAEREISERSCPRFTSHAALFRALLSWARRDLSATEAYARSAMSASQPETRALAGQFLGFVAASRGRYMEQIALLENALAELDTLPARDLWVEVSILENISGIVSGLYLPAVARRMSDRAEAIEWPDEMQMQHHHVMRSLAYSRSLGSDPFLPFEYLDKAAALAPSAVWRLVSRLDRIFLVQEMSGDRIVRDFDIAAEIERAEEIAATIDWKGAEGEQRIGLLLLADILAVRRPDDAAHYLALCRTLQGPMSPLLMAKSDARWIASENFIEGVIIAKNGERDRGIELIRQAFAFWNNVGYSSNATRAAIKLYELTGEERHIEWAFKESRRYPSSWLSDAVSRAGHRRTRRDAHA
jgi:tetratricopeptide (TPR) repeat protein